MIETFLPRSPTCKQLGIMPRSTPESLSVCICVHLWFHFRLMLSHFQQLNMRRKWHHRWTQIHARIFICVHLCPSVVPFSPHVKLLEVAEPSGQAPKPPKVSALVVSYNRKALLRRALEALERSEARDSIEIVVVDNGSTDGSQQLESDFPRARFIRIPRNFGLTKALNLGVRGSEAEYVFFLHEDTEIFPETARLLAALLDSQPDAGAVCPLLVDDADCPAPQLGKFPPDDTWRPAEPVPDRK